MWGVRGRALSHARPPVLGVCGRGPLPTGCGCCVPALGPGFPWHLSPCRGSSCVMPASLVCGTQVAVVAWHLSLCRGCGRRRTSLACLVAPHWCSAPRPVRSLSVLQSALPLPWCLSPPRGLSPPDLLGGCAGQVEAGREPGSFCLPLASAEAGAHGSLRAVPFQGPAMGLSLAGPSGFSLGLRALRWFRVCGPGH